jgi:hypothetical protein
LRHGRHSRGQSHENETSWSAATLPVRSPRSDNEMLAQLAAHLAVIVMELNTDPDPGNRRSASFPSRPTFRPSSCTSGGLLGSRHAETNSEHQRP